MARRAQRLTPAGDFDYERAGAGYARLRRTDPRLAAHVHAALGEARTVLNVGAGAGSYEPEDRYVVAVEPSAAMRAQRPAGRPAVDAVAEALPFDDDSFDAAMAMITVHQWSDLERGLAELQRVARGPVVILTFDPDAMLDFWLADYVPEVFEAERPRMPKLSALGRRGERAADPARLRGRVHRGVLRAAGSVPGPGDPGGAVSVGEDRGGCRAGPDQAGRGLARAARGTRATAICAGDPSTSGRCA